MPMTDEEELWAAAHYVVENAGEAAPVVIASRLGLMAASGDQRGVEAWKKIAARANEVLSRGHTN